MPYRFVIPILILCVSALHSGCSESNTQDLEVTSMDKELLKQADQAETEQLAIGKADQKELKAKIDVIQATLDQVAQASGKWDAKIKTLLSNDDGKKLAANAGALSQFRAVYASEERPTPEALQAAKDRIATLAEPITKALNDPSDPLKPSADTKAEIEKSKQQADAFAKAYEKQEAIVDALISSVANGPAADVSLKDALQEADKQVALQDAAEVEAKYQVAHQARVDKITEAEQARLDAEAEAKAQEIRNQTNGLQADSEKAALVARAKSPDTESRLKPFMALGKTQLIKTANRLNYGAIRRDDPPVPVSLKKITQFGGLEDSDAGRQILVQMANHPKNDRPGWPTPTTSQQWKVVEENQKLLRDLGPTLVELSLLKE